MIALELEGLKRVLNHPLFDLQKRREQTRTFLEELAKIGFQSATVRFAQAEYDGDNDVEVFAPEWIDDHTLQIRAEGKSLLFIEFGTGVYNPIQHPRANALGMVRGEYGQGMGKRRAWVYYGDPGTNGQLIHHGDYYTGAVLTHGNDANMCMWLAAEDMRNQIAKTAERVFTK